MKSYCIAPSHPLVRSIASEYNLTAKQAKAILNHARDEDPSLIGDNIDFKYLKDNKAFKEALAAFKEDELGRDITSDPVGSATDNRERLREEVRKALGDDATEERVELMLDQLDVKNADLMDNMTYIKNVVFMHKDKNIEEYAIIGSYMSRSIVESAYKIFNDKQYAAQQGFNGQYVTMVDLITSEEFIDHILKTVERNTTHYHGTLRFILSALCKNDFRYLGVRVTPTGMLVPINDDAKNSETNNGDGVDGITEGDGSVRDFNESDNERDNRSKVSNYIKMVLSTFTEGMDDLLHLPKVINVNKAIDKLHSICSNCDTVNEMVTAIRSNASSNVRARGGWMNTLADALTLGNGKGFIPGMVMTDSEKERLREEFFKSMNLYFVPMATTMMSKNDGITTFTPNVDSVTPRLMATAKRRYASGKIRVIRDGKIDKDFIFYVLERFQRGSADAKDLHEALNAIGISARKLEVKNANMTFLKDQVRTAYVAISKMGDPSKIGSVLKSHVIPIIQTIGKGTPDKRKMMAHAGGKTFYSWLKPSMISTMMKRLNKGDDKRKGYIEETYGDDAWFVKDRNKTPVFYSHELNAIYNGRIRIEHREKPSIFRKSFNELSSADNVISMLTDFFSTQNRNDVYTGTADYTWYRMFITSDKPRYISVKMSRFGRDYKERVSDQAFDFLEQEIRRAKDVLDAVFDDDSVKMDKYDIKVGDKNRDVLGKYFHREKVTINDVIKDGKYLFKGTGASFYLNKFLNAEIEGRTELGRMVVDAVFNTHGDDTIISEDLAAKFKEGFSDYMGKITWNMYHRCVDNGLFAQKMTYTKNDFGETYGYVDAPNITRFLKSVGSVQSGVHARFKELVEQDMRLDDDGKRRCNKYTSQVAFFMSLVEEYCWHNWYAKTNMAEIFGKDPALFGDTTNFQKRWAQIIASGETPDVNATIHGKQVSDGKLRSITVVTEEERSGSLDNIRLAMERQRDSITDARRRKAFAKNMEVTLKKLEEIDSTDGQAWTSLSGLRKKLNGLGYWSRSKTEELDKVGYVEGKDGKMEYVMTDEAVYRRWLRGECIPEDYLHVFAQPQEPFASGFAKSFRNGRTFTSVFQHKNSEYALIPMAMYAKAKGGNPSSIEEAFAMFMEETRAVKGVQGIDTINVGTAVKVGNNSGAIRISRDMSPEEVLDKLRGAVCHGELNKENPYVDGVVTEFDMEDYHKVANKPEHFKHSRSIIGSQMKVFTVTNLSDNEEVRVSESETLTARQLREEYNELLAKKVRMGVGALERRFGLNMPVELRKRMTSRALLASSLENGMGETHHATSYTLKPVNGELRFYSPLDDPTVQREVEAMLYSQMRRHIYSGKVNGGSVVQASSFANSDDLNIRFHSTNPEDARYGGVVPTLKEYLRDNEGKSELDYLEYIKKYQGGYAYFECEVPMPGDIRRLLTQGTGKKITDFLDKDGNWDMEEIAKVIDPKLLEMVCYRIPTESKYSIMACKVVRFSPEAGGSIAKYPADMITFTGSDFDIDTTYIERRDVISDKDRRRAREEKELNNRLFDLHYAALRANGSLQEAFKDGDFSELSELSYKKVLLSNGYTMRQVNAMDGKALKEACKDVEDLDLMSPVTDDILKSQNSEAKELIGIAAVGNVSHGLLSMVGKESEHITIHVKGPNDRGNMHKSDDTVTFVNDKEWGASPTRLDFAGDVALDDVYDMDGHLISEKIGNYIGASTDAAKDAALSRLNINKTTLPILIFMHRVGVSSDVARLLIANPVMVEACKRMEASGGTVKLWQALNTMRSEVYANVGAGNDKILSSMYNEAQTISYSDLFGALLMSYDELSDGAKMRYLKALSVMSRYANQSKVLDGFVRYASSSAMKHSSFVERYAALRKMMMDVGKLDNEDSTVKLPASLEGTCTFDKLCKALPQVGDAIKAEARLTESLILDNMHTYNSAFFDIVDRMFADTEYVENEGEKLKRLRDAWKSRCLFVGPNRVADFTRKEVFDKYVTDFADSLEERVAEIDRKYGERFLAGNALLDALYLKPITSNDGKEFNVLAINKYDLTGPDLVRLQSDWEKMLRCDESRDLAVDIAIHFLAQDTGFKADSMSDAIPTKVKNAIPNYYKAFDDANKEAMTREEEDRFYIDFVLNNIHMKDVTDRVKPVSFEPQKDGSLKIKVQLPLTSSRIERVGEGDGSKVRYTVPILQMDGKLFNQGVDTYGAVLLNDGEITDIYTGTDINGIEEHTYGTITANLYAQKGAAMEIVEYTGTPDTYLSDDFGEASQDVIQGEPSQATPKERGGDTLGLEDKFVRIVSGSGFDISMSPYEDMGVDIGLDTNETSLASSRTSGGSNKFEESRMFLSRMDKISSALGIRLSKATRNAGSMDASNDYYSFSIEQNDLRVSMADQARMLASAAVLLSGGSKVAVVTERVADADDATHAELVVPIKRNSKEEILAKVREAGITKFHIRNGSELVLMVGKTTNGDFIKATRGTSLKLKGLIDGGLEMLLGEKIDIHYIRRNVVRFADAVKNINDKKLTDNYENERGNRAKVGTRSPYRAIAIGDSRGADSKEGRVRDILSLAGRRAGGEDITEDLLRFFGEMPSRLSSADRSLQSAMLVRDVRGSTSGRFDAMLKEKGVAAEDAASAIDNAIINTANWLQSFRKADVKAAMRGQGFREVDADAIIKEINGKLEDSNIC